MFKKNANLKWLKSSTRQRYLPLTVLKENLKFFSEYRGKFFDKCRNDAKFPNCSKLVTLNSVFKKDAHTPKNH